MSLLGTKGHTRLSLLTFHHPVARVNRFEPQPWINLHQKPIRPNAPSCLKQWEPPKSTPIISCFEALEFGVWSKRTTKKCNKNKYLSILEGHWFWTTLISLVHSGSKVHMSSKSDPKTEHDSGQTTVLQLHQACKQLPSMSNHPWTCETMGASPKFF